MGRPRLSYFKDGEMKIRIWKKKVYERDNLVFIMK